MLIDRFLNPKSVVLYGASTDPHKMGGRVLANLLKNGFEGRVHVVHPKADIVQGIEAKQAAADYGVEITHAIICVPGTDAVEAAMEDAIAAGVRNAVVLSSGFAEEDEAGKAAQARLKARAREVGLHFSGPNALGVMSPANKFYASFSGFLMSNTPKAGHVGIITQSGALGTHVMGRALELGLGISHALFTGNEGDLEAADFIEGMARDPETHVICAALETCSDGPRLRKALQVAAEMDKPVFLVKVGRSEAGARAALSHTGRLAGNDAVYSAVLAEDGCVRPRSVEEMLECALVVSVAGRPKNNRVAILTISGGAGIMAADACTDEGMDPAPMSDDLVAKARGIYPLTLGVNPLDVTANGGMHIEKMEGILEEIVADGSYGTIYLYFAFSGFMTARMALFREMFQRVMAKGPDITFMFASFITEEERDLLHGIGVVDILDPDRGIAALAGAWRSGELQRAARERTLDRPAAMPSGAFAGGGEVAAREYLAGAGLRGPAEKLCGSADEAVAAAEAMGWPVVAKIVSVDLPHKTEIGGVVLGLRDADALRDAYDGIMSRAKAADPNARIDGIMVAEMVIGGQEMIVGGSQDATFGPMVMVGLGGTTAELFGDVKIAPAPVSVARAREMVLGTRSAELLTGWRGSAPLDVDALAQAVSAVSHLVSDPAFGIEEIDINPFRVRETGGLVLDALIVPSGQAADRAAE